MHISATASPAGDGLVHDLVLIAGARPNFMKLAPLLRELAHRGVRAALVHTGQHYGREMSDVFFEQLRMPTPDVHLDIGSASHGVQTGKILIAFEEYLAARKSPPKGVVVVGDVNSTMACALVAVKRGIPVAHVEAGLRSFDRTMPEEINRIVTDTISDLLLVSEPAGLDNLAREGVPGERIRYCGNVMIDSLVDQLPAARALDMPAQFGLRRCEYAVATLHRPSNVDELERLRELVTFLLRMGAELPLVFPVHPRTEKMLRALGFDNELARDCDVRLTPPLGYREFLGLMDGARLVVTDSGGIQEETTFLGVPCVTLRANTERPVTVTRGTNTLVGDDLARAWSVCASILRGTVRKTEPIDGWDGHAALRVVDALVKDLHISVARRATEHRVSSDATADATSSLT
jgi:UDP-N-acetylglucosamine 2-epimerase (non-hydrolysing)